MSATEKDISLSEAIRAFADHVEVPYAPDVPQLIRSLLAIFEKSRLPNDRQVVLDMFAMIIKHYLKYNLYMVNHYDQEYTTKPKGKAGKAGDKRLSEELTVKASKRSYETAFRDKFTLGEDSTRTTLLLLEAFALIQNYLVKFANPKDEEEEENCQLICDWSIETISEMYEEASGSYGSLDDHVNISYDTWQEMFKVIRSCPYFDIIESIFEKFLFSPLDSGEIANTIIKQNSPSRSWVIAYMNYCLWPTIDSPDFDSSLNNHFAILEQDSDDSTVTDRGFSKIRMFLQIMKSISDEEPELIISSCMSNVPIFLNLCGTSKELLGCYMSQLQELEDKILPFIFEYPDSENVIRRMFDILRFSQNSFQPEMLQDHVEALLDSLISICEDHNRCISPGLNEKPSACYRFMKNISASFVAELIAHEDSEKNTKLKMSFVKALCTGNVNNLRLTFKAELLSLFLQAKIKDLKPDILASRHEAFEELFDEMTSCFNSDHLVELAALMFPDLMKFPDLASQQMAMAFFVSLLIGKGFCMRGLYNVIVANFAALRKDPICIYHNLRLLDRWSELYFPGKHILPDHKDYIFLFPMLMETYFKTVRKLSMLEVTDPQYSKLKVLYPRIIRQILTYFGRFAGLRHCNFQLANCFVTTCFRYSSSIPSTPQGYIQIDFLMEVLKQLCVNEPTDHSEFLRNLADLFVKGLQTHFVSKKIGLYIIPQMENELKLLEFFRENEFFMYIFEFFSQQKALRWFHHILKGLLSASISELQSSRAMTPDFVNCGVALFEMFSNGEYYSKSFLRLIDHMQDFNTFTRAEQVTILEEVLRVFARYGAEIRNHWKTDFFRNHFAQSRLLISDKLPNPEEVLAEIENTDWSQPAP